jgi:hypothetical protein
MATLEILQRSYMPETSEQIQFKSETASLVFNSLVDFFIEDYMVKRYVAEKSGWRTLPEVAQKAHVSTSGLYGKTSTLGPSLREPLRRGLIETRFFQGERGRGGEVMRLRIAYEKDPIRELVSRRIRLGKERPSATSNPIDEMIVKVLSESPLLSSLEEDQIRKVIQFSEKPAFSLNEFIVREGDLASGFFIIIDGQAETRQRGRSIRRLGRGQFFGETSLTQHQTRSADVIAVQQTTCLKLSAAQLKELINLDPQIAVKLLEETVRRNRDVTRTSVDE